MIIAAAVSRKQTDVCRYVQEVANRVQDQLKNYCSRKGFPFISRTKSAVSIAEKIETGRFKTWTELDDLFACAVIIPTLIHEEETVQFLRSEFQEIECRRGQTSQKSPEVFRFDSTRFIGKLQRERYPQLPIECLSIRFEIQVRTAFEHAWMEATRSFSYKSSRVDWKYQRLAAQLKAIVEQLDQVVNAYEVSAGEVRPNEWSETRALQIIQEFFEDQVRLGVIPFEAAPENWSRFCDSFFQVIRQAHRPETKDKVKKTEFILSVMRDEFSGWSRSQYPRSLSLIQVCLLVLVNRDIITGPLDRYTPLLTDELRSICPRINTMGRGFDFESR